MLSKMRKFLYWGNCTFLFANAQYNSRTGNEEKKKLLRFQGDFRLFPIGKSEYIPTRATVIVVQPSTWLRYRRPNNGGALQAKGG